MYVYSIDNFLLYYLQERLHLCCVSMVTFIAMASSTMECSSESTPCMVSVHTHVQLHLMTSLLHLAGKMPFKVVVVGGGVSGLMAARQLSYFGLDVTIIEARV